MHAIVLAAVLSLDLVSYRQAAALVDRAVAARGAALVPLAFRIDGVVRQLHQSRRPAEPYLETQLTQTIAADPALRKFLLDETAVWPYFTSRTTFRIERQELSTIRHTIGAHSVTSDGADAAAARVLRRHPDLVLDAALRNRASLRLAASDKVRVALDDGGVMTVTFRNGRLSAIDWIAYNDVFGDVDHRIEYEWSAGEPAGLRQFENGRLVMSGRYQDARRGPEVAVPEAVVPPTSKVASPPSAATPRIEELAPDVFLVRNSGGADYHSLLVRFKDHLVVVEAPRSPQVARTAIAAIKSWDPLRPISQVATTHHHDDHIGGLRAYAEAGVRVITTPGNVSMIRALLDAPHTIHPARDITADVAAVRSGYTVRDDTNELVLLVPGSNDHVAESIIAWLPRQRILFQGDLFRHDPGRPEAARNAAVALWDFIAKEKLPVNAIVGVHGEPASLADLREAIARR